MTGVETNISAKDFFLPMSLRVENSSVGKSNDGDIVNFIFSRDARMAKYDSLLAEDKHKVIPECIRHLINNNFEIKGQDSEYNICGAYASCMISASKIK